jgi:hypothetical protein
VGIKGNMLEKVVAQNWLFSNTISWNQYKSRADKKTKVSNLLVGSWLVSISAYALELYNFLKLVVLSSSSSWVRDSIYTLVHAWTRLVCVLVCQTDSMRSEQKTKWR